MVRKQTPGADNDRQYHWNGCICFPKYAELNQEFKACPVLVTNERETVFLDTYFESDDIMTQINLSHKSTHNKPLGTVNGNKY